MAILEVSHIEKHFGRTNVLKDVSFSMEEGTALALSDLPVLERQRFCAV